MVLSELKTAYGTLEAIHFVGIGGIGMSGIAEIMHELGYKVQGSDICTNDNTKRLAAKGIKIFGVHYPENIANVSCLVVSSAIAPENPEIIAAVERRISVVKRSELLAELMKLKCSVAVTGSHGKTTTTALIACLFEAAGKSPTVINGGISNRHLTNAYLGHSNYLVAEADESDATFVNIPATIAVVTNIDLDHMDFYQNFANLVQAFKTFITNIPSHGFAVCCIDDPVVKDLVNNSSVECKIITYGIDSKDAQVRACNIKFDYDSLCFDVVFDFAYLNGPFVIEEVEAPITGRHNLLNVLAAIAIGMELDFGVSTIKVGFKSFQGIKRRFTKICEYNGAVIIDDYAHHPAEIEATLAPARLIADQRSGRVIAIVQPHRYSRVEYLFNRFSECFRDADEVYVTEIYAANEIPIDGISGKTLVKAINQKNKLPQAKFLGSLEEIQGLVKQIAQLGDLIVLMGAGSISTWANMLPFQLGLDVQLSFGHASSASKGREHHYP